MAPHTPGQTNRVKKNSTKNWNIQSQHEPNMLPHTHVRKVYILCDWECNSFHHGFGPSNGPLWLGILVRLHQQKALPMQSMKSVTASNCLFNVECPKHQHIFFARASRGLARNETTFKNTNTWWKQCPCMAKVWARTWCHCWWHLAASAAPFMSDPIQAKALKWSKTQASRDNRKDGLEQRRAGATILRTCSSPLVSSALMELQFRNSAAAAFGIKASLTLWGGPLTCKSHAAVFRTRGARRKSQVFSLHLSSLHQPELMQTLSESELRNISRKCCCISAERELWSAMSLAKLQNELSCSAGRFNSMAVSKTGKGWNWLKRDFLDTGW